MRALQKRVYTMIRSRLKLAFFSLLCAVILIPPLGGAHLHLCLDGSAPPVTLHMSDSNLLPTTAGESHQDQTVDVSRPALGKAWPPGLDSALLVFVLLVLAGLQQTRALPMLRNIPLPALPQFLRPPLRGPPA